jgi:REP element-mobilizing transposase RayT
MAYKQQFPKSTTEAIQSCVDSWIQDGFTLIRNNEKAPIEPESNHIQLLFKASPKLAPVLFLKNVKGRLDHAFRKLKTPVKFSELNAFRALGANTNKIVAEYIKKQISKENFADNRYRKYLSQFTFENLSHDISEPYKSHSGRYWYNIHLVIVIEKRDYQITRSDVFEQIHNYLLKIAEKKKCIIAKFAIMPDHIHIALRGNIELSPYEIALSFLNNLAYLLRKGRFWSNEFYVGTFSSYALDQIGVDAGPPTKTSTPVAQGHRW